MKTRIELFQPMIDAIDGFTEEKDYPLLVDEIEKVFTAWCPEPIPSLSKKELRAQITAFVTELETIKSLKKEPLTPFWRKNVAQILEITYLPPKKTLFFSRFRSPPRRKINRALEKFKIFLYKKF
jgi:hypothetical protein